MLFLSDGQPLGGEQLGYYQALERCAEVMICEFAQLEHGEPDGDLLAFLKESSFKPDLIMHPAPSGFLPWGFAQAPFPTAYFHIDTFFGTRERTRLAMFFDYAFVFHPGFENGFRRAGHPRVFLLPHAVDQRLFAGPDCERIYEVGWVGSMKQGFYESRRRIIPKLAARFRTNEWSRWHNREEMARAYRSSKIVVNVNRDDHPLDASLRTFEAMAAGALLVTRVPTELTPLGFVEGEHFVGYRSENDIENLVASFLAREEDRCRIATAARQKVLKEHTYDHRAKALLEVIKNDHGELSAPARQWSEAKLRYEYLRYFSDQLRLDAAAHELQKLAGFGRARALRAGRLFCWAATRAFWRAAKG